jgi:hypothetical protein
MMKVSDMTSGEGSAWLRRIRWFVLVAALAVGHAASARADAAPPAGVPTEDGMRAFALQWFAQMQAGKIDRTQYTAAYGAELTDDAVQAMSHHLNEYGAAPIGAEIMQKRSVDNQTLYQVKLIFPRGDAASLLFGFDAEGKITGVAIMSMAGD